MNEEEKKAIEFFNDILEEFKTCNSEYIIDKNDEYNFLQYFKIIIKLIEKQEKEIEEKNDLVLHMKERLNNISFEVECMWRKIEKVENRNE